MLRLGSGRPHAVGIQPRGTALDFLSFYFDQPNAVMLASVTGTSPCQGASARAL
jgi:hypothetical protein